jgi:hypothetical protein
MLQSWLRVLQWYWTGDTVYLAPIRYTRLAQACLVGLRPAGAPQEPQPEHEQLDLLKPNLLDHINALHAEKHAAYGDSWKKRGEPGILANIARKVDRIGSGVDTTDETQADTAQDLLVYLAKYRCWLYGWEGNPEEVARVFKEIPEVERAYAFDYDLDQLFVMAAGTSEEKVKVVDDLLEQAYCLARSLW